MYSKTDMAINVVFFSMFSFLGAMLNSNVEATRTVTHEYLIQEGYSHYHPTTGKFTLPPANPHTILYPVPAEATHEDYGL